MSIETSIEASRIIAVITIDSAEHAEPLAEALLKGGINAIELTFRTEAAEASIRRIAASFPDVTVGAGTVLTPDQLIRAKEAGAAFAVSPGFNRSIVQASIDMKLPFFPGIMTPSDVEGALELGCRLLKFFPAEVAGGTSMLKALAGPYAHTGVKFIPLGGLNRENFIDYLSMPIVAAIGGSWIAERNLIRDEKFAEITNRARDAADRLA